METIGAFALEVISELIDHVLRKQCLLHEVRFTGLNDDEVDEALGLALQAIDAGSDRLKLVSYGRSGNELVILLRSLRAPQQTSYKGKILTQIDIEESCVLYCSSEVEPN
jgi:hypothetical protein